METRKINRLQAYDYSSPGYYFVTICVADRSCCLGDAENGKMILNRNGQIVENFWKEIPTHYPNVKLDEFIVMPNHLHGIIVVEPKRADGIRPYGSDASKIIGYFKQAATKLIRSNGLINFSWQKSFYDHVIRQDESLDNIRQYIHNNPKQWELDEYNPNILKTTAWLSPLP